MRVQVVKVTEPLPVTFTTPPSLCEQKKKRKKEEGYKRGTQRKREEKKEGGKQRQGIYISASWFCHGFVICQKKSIK